MTCAVCNKRECLRCFKCKALFCYHCDAKVKCIKGNDHQAR